MMPGLVTLLQFLKAPPPQALTILWTLRLGSRTGDTPGVQLGRKEAESWGLKRPRASACNAERGLFGPPRCGSRFKLSPALLCRRAVRRGPLSTVGGTESKERARGRRGGQLLRAPPSPLRGSSSPPLLPQPCSTRGEGWGKERGTGDQGGESRLCLGEGGDESWGEQREEEAAAAASQEPALGPAVGLSGATIMVKRKSSEGQEQDSGRGIPLPIQTFLWRQTR